MSPSSRTIQLTDLNSVITCPLCSGYYVDATTLVDCMHSFCKSCILKHFENNKIVCPTCNTTCKRKENFSYYKSDMQLQTLVYKIVPGLYAKETQRREDFYRTAGVRASSSCSDDSVIGDNMQEHEEWINTIGDENQFLSPDDSISLSLEFYQQHLDVPSSPKTDVDSRNSEPEADGNNDDGAKSSSDKNETENADVDKKSEDGGEDKVQSDSYSDSISQEEKVRDRRYLQCPAAVQMIHLQKFIRCKYALSAEHKVDIIHNREVLPPNFTLMDVAYTFKWKRVKPMRFFYRIFTPMKIKPIRIINTSSTGQKQLQIVPLISNPSQENKPPEPPPKFSPPRTSPPKETETTPATIFDSEENNKEKERLMAELQLQSKAKMLENLESPEKHQNARYGKTYERNHEINHAFIGEKRKRETDDKRRDGAPFEKKRRLEVEAGISTKIEKKVETVEEEAGSVFDYADTDQEELKRFAENRDREWQMIKHPEEEHRAYKKRKKSKHSKGEKRKMHAEITSELSNKQESIKLKVKLTPHNGHKHSKHVKNQGDERNSLESRDKERLRQMRQVRHKSIGMDEKTARTSEKKPKELEAKSEFTITLAKTTTETQTRTTEVEMKTSETQTKSSETQTVSKEDKKDKTEGVFAGKTLRSDFTIKTATGKEILNKQAIVQAEKIDQIDKPVLKALPRIPYTKQDKIKSESTEKKIAQTTKSLQQQISLLCKTKEKQMEPPKLEKKVTFSSEKPRILNTQYLPGFTVSKIEAGAKKKPEVADPNQDKRPSLEITPINPPPSNITTETTSITTVSKPSSSTAAKRPLPPTIPLERIKSMKDIATLSGISIIAKVSEKCDNIGALDLSKPHKSTDTKIDLNKNGLNPNGNGLKPIPTVGDKGPLSNLQMLSKVATEHPNINKPLNVQNKSRQQIPALQNIKLPAGTVQNHPGSKSANLAKIPKLNEINKGQFRMSNSPRTMRPNQNQSIRNIPNPSLLVRQQNQNRMNSLSVTPTSGEKEVKGNTTTAPEGDRKLEETKPVEKCDITVSKT